MIKSAEIQRPYPLGHGGHPSIISVFEKFNFVCINVAIYDPEHDVEIVFAVYHHSVNDADALIGLF